MPTPTLSREPPDRPAGGKPPAQLARSDRFSGPQRAICSLTLGAVATRSPSLPPFRTKIPGGREGEREATARKQENARERAGPSPPQQKTRNLSVPGFPCHPIGELVLGQPIAAKRGRFAVTGWPERASQSMPGLRSEPWRARSFLTNSQCLRSVNAHPPGWSKSWSGC